MNGIQYNHLKHIIDFMYQGEIKVLDSDLEGVLALGESLQVKGLCSVKLRQKIALNSDAKSEKPESPVPFQPVLTKRQTTPVEPKPNVENTKVIVPPLKVYSRASTSNNQVQVPENLSVNKLQEEPKNYSKVSLDALAENSHSVNKPAIEERVGKIVTVLGQPISIDEGSEEPSPKKVKGNPPPLIVRKSVSFNTIFEVKSNQLNFLIDICSYLYKLTQKL